MPALGDGNKVGTLPPLLHDISVFTALPRLPESLSTNLPSQCQHGPKWSTWTSLCELWSVQMGCPLCIKHTLEVENVHNKRYAHYLLIGNISYWLKDNTLERMGLNQRSR